MTTSLHHSRVGFIPGMHSRFNIWKKVSVTHHINRLKKKSHMTTSVNTEKVFDKV